MPVRDFDNAFSTFVAQNKGANEEKRIQDGLKIASLMALVFCIFSKELMMLFVSKMNIIKIGMTYLRVEGSFYIGIGCIWLLSWCRKDENVIDSNNCFT